MNIKVEYFGIISDLSRRKEESIALEDGATVADALAHLASVNPHFAQIAKQVRTVVNGKAASKEDVLHDGDELALMRAIGGGNAMNRQGNTSA